MEPKLAGYHDTVRQNVRLFERIEKIYNARESSGLTPEQQRLVWDYYTDFLREGAKLAPEHKAVLNQAKTTPASSGGTERSPCRMERSLRRSSAV